ncbi:MAG: hypothetical protein ACREVX_05510 [Clostridium sp.]|uniref:hypothetical protein n=1 Tax=Clostridium sp. TaxID=1506 RepID=UPI003D6D1EC1
MFIKKDERDQTVNRITMRYTCFFQTILIVALFIIFTVNKDLRLLPPFIIFNYPIYISVSPAVEFIAISQYIVVFVSQAILNKRFGGPTKPIVSENNKMRFMDERERMVSDKAVKVSFIFSNVVLITWSIIQFSLSGKLDLTLSIIFLEIIFYNIMKIILLHHYGENIS